MGENRNGSPRFSETCKRCGGAFQYLAALPKSIGDDGYDVYRCVDCKGIEWVSRQSEWDRAD